MASRSQVSQNWRNGSQKPYSPYSKIDTSSVGRHGAQSQDTPRGDLEKTPRSAICVEARGENDPRTLLATEEGRRLYVGNLAYRAKTKDIEDLFAINGYQIEYINMSTDPFTGRNPSYCFVDLASKCDAERAMQELSSKNILGRPVKLGPGVAASRKRKATNQHHSTHTDGSPTFQRWTRNDASDHFKGYSEQGRRVWVGGLPKMGQHDAVDLGIRELFTGFEIEAVSKVVIPRAPTSGDPKAGNNRYLFVDFRTADEAARAVRAADGKYAWDVKVRVQVARNADSWKARERNEWREESSDLHPSDSELQY
ncbi:MAG: hypothetical protein Q9170_004566 [Blastenia crenularia]